MVDLGGGGQQWTTMGNNGQQWTTMDNNGQQWTTMNNNGQQWSTMDNNEQQRTLSIGQQSVVLHASTIPFFSSSEKEPQAISNFKKTGFIN